MTSLLGYSWLSKNTFWDGSNFHTCGSKLEYVERKRKREKEGEKGKKKEKSKEKGTAKILDGSFVETSLHDNIENKTACSDKIF